MPKITVHKAGSQDDSHFLRVHLSASEGGIIRFETAPEFSKREADLRAVLLSKNYGWQRDELPTHAPVEPYPKEV